MERIHRVVAELTEDHITQCLLIAEGAASYDQYDCCLVDHTQSTRISLNAKGYVQIKVLGHSNPNKKVQLHQLVAWMHPEAEHRAALRAAIANESSHLEISHLCKQKACMQPHHLHAEASDVNKSRNGCPAVVKINGTFFPCCKHDPLCIPSALDYTTAPCYEL